MERKKNSIDLASENRRLTEEVTELRNRLADIQDEYAKLLDSLPIYVYAEDVNDGFRHVRANAISCELWGRTIDEVIGKADEDLFTDPEQVKAFRAADVEAARSDRFLVQDMPFTGADGKRRIGRFVRRSMHLSNGRHWLYGFVTDITDTVENELRIKDLNARLEQSLAHKRFRSSALSFMLGHPSVDELVAFIAERLLTLFGCDRVSVGGSDGSCRTWTKPGLEMPDCGCFNRCPLCPLNPESAGEERVISIRDVRRAEGRTFPEGCLAKSVVSILVQDGGRPWRRITLHYMQERHEASGYELRTLESVSNLVATALERQRLMAAQNAETALRARALDNAPIAVFIKDADDDFRYVFINDFTLAQIGLRREEVLGRTDFDIMPREAAALYRRNDEAAMGMDESFSVPENYVDTAGRTRRVQSIRCSAIGADGHRLVVGYSLDLTEQMERQRRIETLQRTAEKERDRAVAAEQADSFIARILKHVVSFGPEVDPMDYVLSEIGSYAEADRCSIYYYREPGRSGLIDSAYEWCAAGIPSAVARRQKCDMADRPDFHANILAGDDFFLLDGVAVHPDTQAHLAEAGLRGLIATPILDEHGGVVGFVGFDYVRAPLRAVPKMLVGSIHEAVDVISVCRTRRLAFETIQAAERAKADFFASVSHDIRTPLNSIIGFSELLKNEADPDVRRDYLDSIAFSGNTLLELINDVLDLARLDAGKLSLVREPFDLRRQVRLILRTFESAAREKCLSLKSEIGELPVLMLDEQRARQVLFNLVGNAVKYTDAGGVSVSASFERTSAREGTLRVSVRDTGIGIAAEDIAKLMRPYVRLQVVNARGGTGLGLAICKRIVESMGGSISISSEPGKGSVFAVLLPNVPYREAGVGATGKDATAAAAAEGGEAATVAALPPRDFSALRVLVVDDLEMNRRVLVAVCRRLGAGHAVEAASSVEALDLLRREPFDLVLTDMKMPGMDGGEFIRAVRDELKLHDLPVFLVTADIEARKYYKDLGADGVLLKPVVMARLAETLSGVCVKIDDR